MYVSCVLTAMAKEITLNADEDRAMLLTHEKMEFVKKHIPSVEIKEIETKESDWK